MSVPADSGDVSGTTPEPIATIQLHQQQKPFHKFQRAEPKALGVTMVMLGIALCSFGFPIHLAKPSQMTFMGVPWWMAVLLIISGSLAVECNRQPNKPRVTACLATNLINAIASGVAIIVCSVDIANVSIMEVTEEEVSVNFLNLLRAMKSILLFFIVCGLVLNIVISVFCCKGLRYCTPSTNMPVVVVINPNSERPTFSTPVSTK